jgi:hypothetical protein
MLKAASRYTLPFLTIFAFLAMGCTGSAVQPSVADCRWIAVQSAPSMAPTTNLDVLCPTFEEASMSCFGNAQEHGPVIIYLCKSELGDR